MSVAFLYFYSVMWTEETWCVFREKLISSLYCALSRVCLVFGLFHVRHYKMQNFCSYLHKVSMRSGRNLCFASHITRWKDFAAVYVNQWGSGKMNLKSLKDKVRGWYAFHRVLRLRSRDWTPTLHVISKHFWFISATCKFKENMFIWWNCSRIRKVCRRTVLARDRPLDSFGKETSIGLVKYLVQESSQSN